MADVRERAAGDDLRILLHPWLTPGLDHPPAFRFHDAPPEQVRRALAAVDPEWGTTRFNGQPPASWLVSTAERLDGRLAGQVGDDVGLPTRLRVDAICVPGERAQELAQAVHDDWPEPVLDSVALDLALAEGWEAWDAEQPVWTLAGRQLLEAPPAAAVVGLWWD